MSLKTVVSQAVMIVGLASALAGCNAASSPMTPSPTAARLEASSTLPATRIVATTPTRQVSSGVDLSPYAFPASIDPTKHYLFYVHGKIIEDQGLPASSPDYGDYEYQAILEKLAGYGFVVVSQQRPKGADGVKYASELAAQLAALLHAGVPAGSIAVIGASKGAWIAAYASHLLQNKDISYVIMAICDPATVADFKRNGISLSGNVLSIYDSSDEFAGSCQDLFAFSEDKGLSRHDEIVLHVGTGHGILYKPLDAWIVPAVQWAGKP